VGVGILRLVRSVLVCLVSVWKGSFSVLVRSRQGRRGGGETKEVVSKRWRRFRGVGVGGIGRLGWTTDVDPTAEERVRGWGHWGGAARKSLLEHAKIGERRNGA
jgi:hypothetical protein